MMMMIPEALISDFDPKLGFYSLNSLYSTNNIVLLFVVFLKRNNEEVMETTTCL